MLWYKLNGTWQTWDYLHNTLGYSESATVDVSYKGAGLNDWGQSVTTGYLYGVVTDFLSGTMFASGKVGWYSLNGMATECKLYPSQATDDTLFGPSGGSPAACLICNGVSYYLIRDALNLGWMTESECEDNGWVRGAPVCGDMGADYSNSMLSGMPDRILNGTILFTGELRENVMPESGRQTIGTISFTGELRDNVIPESGVVEEWVNNTIELDLGFSYFPGSGGVWRAEDLYSGNSQPLQPISQTDADNLTTFGLQLKTYGLSYEGPYGHLDIGNTAFTYDVICLYAGLNSSGGSNPISIDPSDFSVIARGFPSTDGMYLTCGSRYNAVRGCRMKITKPEQ